jgi:hypothetical protein
MDDYDKILKGGEVRPENVKYVFESTFGAPSENKQDFYTCTQLTHATYSKVSALFRSDSNMSSDEVYNANWNSARMGYSFQIVSVSAIAESLQKSSNGNNDRSDNTAALSELLELDPKMIDIDVVVENIGVAPIYYPTSIVLNCPGLLSPYFLGGVELIIDPFTTRTFSFQGIPGTRTCLNDVTLHLTSKHAHPSRPIKWAQGATGTNVTFRIPLPPIL